MNLSKYFTNSKQPIRYSANYHGMDIRRKDGLICVEFTTPRAVAQHLQTSQIVYLKRDCTTRHKTLLRSNWSWRNSKYFTHKYSSLYYMSCPGRVHVICTFCMTREDSDTYETILKLCTFSTEL